MSRVAARPHHVSRARRARRRGVGRGAHYERGGAQDHRDGTGGAHTRSHRGPSGRDLGEATPSAGVPTGQAVSLSGPRLHTEVLLDSPRACDRCPCRQSDGGLLAVASRRHTASRRLLRSSPLARRTCAAPLQLGTRTWPRTRRRFLRLATRTARASADADRYQGAPLLATRHRNSHDRHRSLASGQSAPRPRLARTRLTISYAHALDRVAAGGLALIPLSLGSRSTDGLASLRESRPYD